MTLHSWARSAAREEERHDRMASRGRYDPE